MRDDTDLLRSFVDERSEAAFSELVHRHIDVVYATALRRVRGDTHRAEDVTQLVFSTLARKAASVLRHPSLLGWLHTTTRLAAADLLRREQRRRIREVRASTGELAGASESDAASTDWEQLRPLLDQALDELRPSDREAVLMRFFAGSGWAEIGRHFRVPEDTARKRVDYALERLRRQLARRGVHSSAAALAAGLGPATAVSAPLGLANAVAQTALLSGTGLSTSASLSLFMNTTKLSSGFGALTLAAVSVVGTASLAIVAWNGHLQVTEIRRQFTSNISEAENRNAQMRAGIAKARKLATPKQSNTNRPASEAPPANSALAAQIAMLEAYAASLEYMALMRQENRLRVQKEYAEFFASQALTRGTAERLKELLAQRRERSLFLTLEYSKRGPAPGDRAFVNDSGGIGVQAAPDEADLAITAQIKELLGEPIFQEFERFQDLHMYSFPAQRIAADCRDYQEPLTAAQQRQLLEILHRTKLSVGQAVDVASTVDPNPTAQESALIAEAGTFLTPGQTNILSQFLVDQRVAETLGRFDFGAAANRQ